MLGRSLIVWLGVIKDDVEVVVVDLFDRQPDHREDRHERCPSSWPHWLSPQFYFEQRLLVGREKDGPDSITYVRNGLLGPIDGLNCMSFRSYTMFPAVKSEGEPWET